jgi:hypothetical protein
MPPLLDGLPDWVTWIAQDKSGAWWGFEAEPNEGHDFWYENEVGRSIMLGSGKCNADWRNSLLKAKNI